MKQKHKEKQPTPPTPPSQGHQSGFMRLSVFIISLYLLREVVPVNVIAV